MSSIRIKKVESLIRDELSTMIIRGVIKHPSVNNLISITHVKVSGDLSHCKVYISSFESVTKARKAVSGLKKSSGFIQGKLGKKLHMRTIPRLDFYFDESIEEGFKVNKLINDITEHDEN